MNRQFHDNMAVIFEEEQYTNSEVRSNERGILGLVVQLGLAKTKNQAQYVLLIIIILSIIITIYLLSQIGESSVPISDPSST